MAPIRSIAIGANRTKLNINLKPVTSTQIRDLFFAVVFFLALRPRLGSEISLTCGIRSAVCHVYLERMRSLVILPLFRTDHAPRPHRTPIRA